MKRNIALVAVMGVLATGFLAGQDRNPRFENPRSSGNVFWFWEPPLRAPLRWGPPVDDLPIVGFPRETAALFIADRFLLGRRQILKPGSGSFFLFEPYVGYPTPFGWPAYGYGGQTTGYAYYDSQRFVDEWKNKDPFIADGDSRVSGSLLLSEGMEEEEVVRRLGSPLQRVQLGDRQVWKYSGFSLLFKGGKLREIR